MPRLFPTPVLLAHLLVNQVLRVGDSAVDATAGNGHDTLYLAQRVGDTGKVYAFDVQRGALLRTAERLRAEGLENRVVLIQAGHERLKEFIPAGIKTAMFNLGYLPGGDHRIITRPGTTIAALKQTLDLLEPGGLATVVVYRGHDGGKEEGEAVSKFIQNLDRKRWDVISTVFPSRSAHAPFLVALQKTGDFQKEGGSL